jgi:hypothetical protein
MGSRGPSHRQACAIVRRMRQDRNTATRASFATYTKKERYKKQTNKQRRDEKDDPGPIHHPTRRLISPSRLHFPGVHNLSYVYDLPLSSLFCQ